MIRSAPHRDMTGFTLLEVILALAILGMSLAMIGGVTRLAYDNARGATDELEARLVAESVMGEILGGSREMVAAPSTPVNTEQGVVPRYEFSVQVEGTTTPAILLVRVIVTEAKTGVDDGRPAKELCRVERWKIDPAYLQEVAAASTL